MALPSSGTISMNQIRNEFRKSTGAINQYYRDASDPYIGTIPTSGTISYSNFHGSSVRTARMRAGRVTTAFTYNNVIFAKLGYGVSNGTRLWHPESGENGQAMGTSTRRSYMSTTANLGGIHYFSYGSSHRHISISHQSSSNSGWTFCDFKGQDYFGNTVTATLRRANSSGSGGVYRGFKRIGFSNSTQRSYYMWSWSWESYQSNSALQRIANMITFSYLRNVDFFVRFR